MSSVKSTEVYLWMNGLADLTVPSYLIKIVFPQFCEHVPLRDFKIIGVCY